MLKLLIYIYHAPAMPVFYKNSAGGIVIRQVLSFVETGTKFHAPAMPVIEKSLICKTTSTPSVQGVDNTLRNFKTEQLAFS